MILPKAPTWYIPNDAHQRRRGAAACLQKAGVNPLKDEGNNPLHPAVISPKTRRNIPHRELKLPPCARTQTQVDLALIQTNYALEAGLKPGLKMQLVIGRCESPYVQILSARSDNAEAMPSRSWPRR